MNKFVQRFITIETSIQLATLIGLMLFFGYLGFMNYPSAHTPDVPVASPTMQ